jgi:hypothetical protein
MDHHSRTYRSVGKQRNSADPLSRNQLDPSLLSKGISKASIAIISRELRFRPADTVKHPDIKLRGSSNIYMWENGHSP